MRDLCLIIDGNSLMHRAFHALPLMDINGVYTNAVHGFLMMMLKAIEEWKPRYVMTAFDEKTPTFRHTAYAEYKAGRKAMPEEMKGQFPIIREILSEMGLGVFSVTGYEADDILGTAARVCEENDIDALLLTGDRDALQLVKGGCRVLFTRKGISETVVFDASAVREYFGITPEQVTDWKGLMGDSSDNIPGVPGVGEKTAVKLLQDYGTLESVLENAESIKGKLGEKLRDNRDLALFCKDLATIRPTAPVELRFSEMTADHLEKGIPALKKYSLNGIVQRVMKGMEGADTLEPEMEAEEETVFDVCSPQTKEDISDFLKGCDGEIAALFIEPEMITVAWGNHLARIAPQMDLLSFGMSNEEVMEALTPVLKGKIITHDGKKLMHMLLNQGLPVPDITFDTMLAAWLLDPLRKDYSLRSFGENDAGTILKIAREQEKKLKKEGLFDLFDRIEMPLMHTLFRMELTGFRVDKQELSRLSARFTEEADELREQVFASVGQRFNLNSPQQLSRVLFEDLMLKHGKKTSLGYSTDVDTLEKLQDEHPCIPLILRYRQVAKLNGTYTDALMRKMDREGRIHSFFDQTGTVTGRISSSEPNLQNIPVRTESGRLIRRAFVASEGRVLVDADYSQIELRVLAHLSGDKNMCDAFNRGQDIHTATAAEVYGVKPEEVTKEMRSASKAVNFGLVYGISEFGLARNIGITRKEAADFIARYFSRYPGVHAYMDEAVKNGYETGTAVTLMGRRRTLPELKSPNGNTRAFGERVAMNAPVQGTAADIIKLAMVEVDKRLNEGHFEAKLILQVHDELILEAPIDEAEKVAAMLKECMEKVVTLKVPLVAEVNIGESWAETK